MGPLSSCSPRVERLVSVSAACSVICFRGGHACHAAEPGRGPGRSPVLCIHPVPIGCTLRARRCSKDTELWRVTDQRERQTRGHGMRRGSRWGPTGERASWRWPGRWDFRTRGEPSRRGPGGLGAWVFSERSSVVRAEAAGTGLPRAGGLVWWLWGACL